MDRIRQATAALLLGTFIAHPALAQERHIADQSVLDARLASKVAETDQRRAAIKRLLEREAVREIAARAGIDIASVETAVASLDHDELAQLAEQAQRIDDSLAGGQSTVTISTTTIIIALLIIILIIVAV